MTPPEPAKKTGDKTGDGSLSSAENQYLRVSATSANADGYYRLELGDGTISDASLFKLSYNQVSRGYQLFPKTNEGLSLDVYGALAESGSDVVFCPNHYGTNQTFILEKVSPRITSSMTYQDNGNFPESVTDSRKTGDGSLS